MKRVKSTDGELVVATKVKYEECSCCGSTWYYCPKCGSKIYIDVIGIQSCKACSEILEVVIGE